MVLTDVGNLKEIDFLKAWFPLLNFLRNVGIEFYPVSQRTQGLVISEQCKGHVIPEQHTELTKFFFFLTFGGL